VNDEDIPHNVRVFISEHIHSVLELESLLLFAAAPDRSWTAEQLSRELRINMQWAAEQIAELAKRETIAVDAATPMHYRYAPRDGTKAQTVKDVARAYADRRVAVIQLIYSKPGDPVQSFADAFRFRKGKPNE
jgi:hypothetical protein